jgi:hypothetical protein
MARMEYYPANFHERPRTTERHTTGLVCGTSVGRLWDECGTGRLLKRRKHAGRCVKETVSVSVTMDQPLKSTGSHPKPPTVA